MANVLIAPGKGVNLQRRLGPFEHLLWLVDQWTPRHFILVARIEGAPVTIDDLRSGLLQCQHRHPILRAAIHTNTDGVPEFIPSDAPILLRVIRRTNNNQWLKEVETQLALGFERDDQPLMRVSVVQGEVVSELILAVHHSIGDGVSAMFLVKDLLESMEGLSLEALPSRPAVEELLGGFQTNLTNRLPVPMSSSSVTRIERPEKAFLQIFEIGRGELSRILERSREEGTTFHGALLAALLLSLPATQETLQCVAPINLRKFLPTPSGDFGLYISAGMAILNRNTAPDFWSLARSAREQVMQGFNLEALSARAAATSFVVAGKPNPQTAYEQVWRRGGYDAVLTNLGWFPQMPKLERFRVTAAYPILSPELEPIVAVATVDQSAYITISTPPALAGISSKFFNLLRQHTY